MNAGVRKGEILVFLAITAALELFFSRYLRTALYVDLPLLFSLYIGWCSDAVQGALAGTGFGLLLDVVERLPLGLNGLSKTVLAFGAAYLARWVILETFLLRVLVLSLLALGDRLIVYAMFALLVESPPTGYGRSALVQAVATGLTGGVLFQVLDRLKRPPKDFRRLNP